MDNAYIPREFLIRTCRERYKEHQATLARLPWWRFFTRHDTQVRMNVCLMVLGEQLLTCEASTRKDDNADT